ncbi:unnamed protein product, partial [Didymodactylos carnosus]
MAYIWLRYAKSLLKKCYCEHYFLKNVNILEYYSEKSIEEAFHIHENDVDIYAIRDQFVKKSVEIKRNDFRSQ